MGDHIFRVGDKLFDHVSLNAQNVVKRFVLTPTAIGSIFIGMSLTARIRTPSRMPVLW